MRVAVLGAGAWGTAIACVLSARHEVALWARDAAQASALVKTRRNERYLRGIEIPSAVTVTSDLAAATSGVSLALVATPVAGLREVLQKVKPPLVWLCKGFEQGSGALPHVHGGRMRVYYSADLVGVEIGGAVKNVMAIAAGISDGLGLGLNARAALITRGLAEIARLGTALGAQPETLMGLAGAGDLILTATGDLSRNRKVGVELARGKSLQDILKDLGHVAEGVRSAKEVAALAKKQKVDMPVTDAVNAVLEGKLAPAAAVSSLLSRDPKREG
jgi:glycerol-3-phosphate dehydrogenase (NAD(P)+)